MHLSWQYPRSRVEGILLWEQLQHFIQMVTHSIFSSNIGHAREVIDDLPWLYSPKAFMYRCYIDPKHVSRRILLIFMHQLPSKLLSNVSDHTVLALGCCEADLFTAIALSSSFLRTLS